MSEPRTEPPQPFTVTGYSLRDLASALGITTAQLYRLHRHEVKTVRFRVREFVPVDEFHRVVAALGGPEPPP